MRYLSRVVSEEKWNTGINILAKYGVILCPEYWKETENLNQIREKIKIQYFKY